ncbi:uncharacterized protein CELE_C56G2.22 [Caenorhabditis elegans]|uniref:Uncharacterized protein n=1 Tax=Caenorhabditis elegans TaxID=6239 RepID=A0A2K5ATU6_CAEEL|nr:Uncharacterized protein CELE_C56G2.22 [Caenorhabditis elegans]SPC47540.2 Uncharacterized protein CELE_C56G2.22 [Caenorhabditis elegans]|eukprot:NP_001348745.2 Uncharacterized protein CELE_C56G2.22 [Caenorhabditis elegans]
MNRRISHHSGNEQ